MPVSPSRYELLQKRLDRFTQMLHGVGKGDERALHQTRVASRRLRELLPVLQLEGKVAGELGRRLRKVIQRLGRIRELDVTLMLVEELKTAGDYDGDALERVGRQSVRSASGRVKNCWRSGRLVKFAASGRSLPIWSTRSSRPTTAARPSRAGCAGRSMRGFIGGVPS
jgi:CHAD domain-containing protein